MSAPIHLDGPYRPRRSRLLRALTRFALRQWIAAWLELTAVAIVLALLVAGMPFIAGALSAYLPGV